MHGCTGFDFTQIRAKQRSIAAFCRSDTESAGNWNRGRDARIAIAGKLRALCLVVAEMDDSDTGLKRMPAERERSELCTTAVTICFYVNL